MDQKQDLRTRNEEATFFLSKTKHWNIDSRGVCVRVCGGGGEGGSKILNFHWVPRAREKRGRGGLFRSNSG